jgi:Tol biopolymer transport system component
MNTTQDFDLPSGDLGPRLEDWMASTAPTREPAGLVAGAIERTGSVRQRPGFLVRIGSRKRIFAMPDLPRRAQLVFLAGLVIVGIGASATVGARLVVPPTPSNPPKVTSDLSNSLIVIMPDGDSRAIRVVRPDGTDVADIGVGSTNGCGRHVLTADGSRLAYWTRGGSNDPIRILPLDGSKGVTVPLFSGRILGSAFSPDRTRFAYLTGTPERSDLTILSLIDGTSTVIARDLRHANLYPLGWSVGDSLAIGYVDDIEFGVDLIAADGTNHRSLVRRPLAGRSTSWGMAFSWSPDGTRLAYSSGDTTRETWVIDVATGSSIVVATADGTPVDAWTVFANAEYFLWGPDGRSVTYPIGDRGFAFLDLASGETRTVPDGGRPFWSPDGSRFAYIGDGEPTRLTTMRADLSGRVDQEVASGTWPLAWSPDSRRIAVLSGSALDLVDPSGIEPPTRIVNDVAPGPYYCLTWSGIDAP